jgi:hypothetical protein
MNANKIIGLVLILLFSLSVYSQTEKKELLVVAHNYKWGFMTKDGKIVIPLQFDYTDGFSEGLSTACLDIVIGHQPYGAFGQNQTRFSQIENNLQKISQTGFIEKNGAWGFYDSKNKFITLPQFEKNWYEIRGNYPTAKGTLITAGRRCGFINEAGKVIVPVKYDGIRNFSEGLAALKQNDKFGYGFIDKTGKFVIKPQFEKALDFAEGLAAFRINEKWGFIDKSGELKIQPQFDDVMGGYFSSLVAVKKDDKWGLIDKDGKPVGEFIFDDIDWLKNYREEGLVGVEIAEKQGFINYKGETAIELKYDYVLPFREGLAAVELNEKYGFIDKSGNIAIDFKYDEANNFNEGLAQIVVNDKIGFIDRNGNEIIKPQYDDARDFSEGLAVVAFGARIPVRYKDKKYGYVDKTGNVVIPIRFDLATDFKKGLAYVELGDKQCEINKRGEFVLCSSPK